ncbi:hypothetical protein HOD20_10175 [archaeon]|jgi:hypothetical protein|nr:hypothetical protein [archaeon]MBT4352877.1 hypothetical protein [archaeon]MBT4646928.1 hypothetical protein [archaeon]MBT6820804.1 hypothetical protein [archaeon]MBT7391523.1 hypothetical protein [archaeon]
MLKINSKKGQEDLTRQLLVDLIIILVLVIVLINAIGKYIDSSRFEAKFIAKDMAFMIDSIYASPSDITIRYPQKTEEFTYEFFDDGKVSVLKDGTYLATEYFTPQKGIKFINKTLKPQIESKEKNNVNIFNFDGKKMGFVPLKFEKKGNIIEISQAINIYNE